MSVRSNKHGDGGGVEHDGLSLNRWVRRLIFCPGIDQSLVIRRRPDADLAVCQMYTLIVFAQQMLGLYSGMHGPRNKRIIHPITHFAPPHLTFYFASITSSKIRPNALRDQILFS